jgi:IclR family KDG regulon transcriptional repressor
MKRLITIINYLATSDKQYGVTEVSKELKIPKTTVYRILSTLVDEQWVVKNPESRKYSLSDTFLQMGLSLLSRHNLRRVSLPFLNNLQGLTNESAALSIRIGMERMYIEMVESESEVRIVVPLGIRIPLWAGAIGKVMLAHMKDEEKEKIIRKLVHEGVKTYPTGQALHISELENELNDIRNQGYAIGSGERVPGAYAVAAPVFDKDSQVAGAISLHGPTPRFTLELAISSAPVVCEAAHKISLQMGASFS